MNCQCRHTTKRDREMKVQPDLQERTLPRFVQQLIADMHLAVSKTDDLQARIILLLGKSREESCKLALWNLGNPVTHQAAHSARFECKIQLVEQLQKGLTFAARYGVDVARDYVDLLQTGFQRQTVT